MIRKNRLLKSERQLRILKMLESSGQVTVPEVSGLFGVSEVTVRRDLEEMDLQGALKRTHGGAIQNLLLNEPPVLERYREQTEEKRRIGRCTAGLLRNGETIFLGSGSTVMEVAKNISRELNLTVITNSLPILNELSGYMNINLIAIGGMFHKYELSFIGYVAEIALKEFRADRVIMGFRSIDLDQGFTNEYFPESTIDRALFQFAPRVTVVADHTKFGRVSPVFVAPVTAARTLVTDHGISDSLIEQLREKGLEVIVA